jgi:hypothetical protein
LIRFAQLTVRLLQLLRAQEDFALHLLSTEPLRRTGPCVPHRIRLFRFCLHK